MIVQTISRCACFVGALFICSPMLAQDTNKRTSDIAKHAEAYFKRNGYIVMHVSVNTIRGTEWVIVQGKYGTYASKGAPVGLSYLTFSDGYYFCKPGLSGGVESLLDEDGNEVFFLSSDWIFIK